MKIDQAPSVLKRDADQLGIDLNSAEYGYAVSLADLTETPEEAEAIDQAERAPESGVHHG